MLNLEVLQKSFLDVSFPVLFRDFDSKLIKDDTNTPPKVYLPYVGGRYEEHRVLFYSTAQNLAGPKEKLLVNAYGKYPEQAMNRLEYKWRGDKPEKSGKDIYEFCEVGPVAGGVIPALASVFLKAKYNICIGDADQAMSYLSFGNFYKLSLFKMSPDQVRADLNPRDMGEADRQKYTKLMFDNYIKMELDVLKPKTVICFKGQCCDELKKALIEKKIAPFELLEINDTAWILRGARCLRKGGSWYQEEIPDDFKELLSTLTEKSRFRHGYLGREDAIRVYLNHYYHQFLHTNAMP